MPDFPTHRISDFRDFLTHRTSDLPGFLTHETPWSIWFPGSSDSQFIRFTEKLAFCGKDQLICGGTIHERGAAAKSPLSRTAHCRFISNATGRRSSGRPQESWGKDRFQARPSPGSLDFGDRKTRRNTSAGNRASQKSWPVETHRESRFRCD